MDRTAFANDDEVGERIICMRKEKQWPGLNARNSDMTRDGDVAWRGVAGRPRGQLAHSDRIKFLTHFERCAGEKEGRERERGGRGEKERVRGG